MMKVKGKISAFLLLTALAAVLFAGCSQGEAREDSTGKGRYVEEDMELPLETGEQLISFTESKDGNPLLFSIHYIVEDSVQMEVKRYEYIDGGWEGKAVDWFAEMYGGHIAASEAVDMEEADDGTQVLMMKEQNSYRQFLLRGKDGEAGEELDVPLMSEKTGGEYRWFMDLLIDGKGNYWLRERSWNVTVLSSDTLGKVLNLEMPYYSSGESSGAKIMFKGKDGTVAIQLEEGKFTLFDADSLKESGSLAFDKEGYPQLCSDGKNWYAVSEEGISRCQPGNDINEIIMDGSMGSFGSPLYIPVSAVTGREDDFYVLYKHSKDWTYSLKHYVYDADLASVPETTLTVFGLSDNDTVREAIQHYQKENPDVWINFQTSGKSENEITTDDIRTLNTELLSGNGADVLIMDGLPIDSYIEKGMLEDLTELMQNITKNTPYMENMLKNTAQSDGAVYALPLKFKVPVMYGSQEVQEALESIGTLSAYLDADPEASIFGAADYGYIGNLLFVLYQDEIVGPNEKIDEVKLEKLLELEKKICINDQAGAVDVGGDRPRHYSLSDDEDLFKSEVSNALAKYPDAVGTAEIDSVESMSLPYVIIRESGLTPVSIQNMYSPAGIAAVNKNSQQKELAKDFIKYMLSEEVQMIKLSDGFPVLESALEEKITELDSRSVSGTGYSLTSFVGDESIRTTTGLDSLTEEEVGTVLDLSRTLTKPLKQDRVIWGIYQETTDKYLEGSIDVKEAVRTIAQKADTYLTE